MYWTPLDKFSGLKPMTRAEIRDAGIPLDLFEHSDFTDYENCLWFVAVTMTTLGQTSVIESVHDC